MWKIEVNGSWSWENKGQKEESGSINTISVKQKMSNIKIY